MSLLIMLVHGSVWAQNVKIDSLNSILPGKRDRERLDVMYQLTGEYILAGSFTEAQTLGDETWRDAAILGDSVRMMKIGLLQASIFRRTGRFETAAEMYRYIVPLVRRQGTATDIAVALNSYGLTLQYMAEYKLAMKYLLESAKYRLMTGDQASLHIVYNNIGLINYKLQYIRKALDYYFLCEKVKDDIDTDYDRDVLYNNIALCYINLGDYAKARQYNERSVSYCEGLCPVKTQLGQHYVEGLIYAYQDNFKLAEREFLESYKLSLQQKDIRYQADIMLELGQLALNNGNLVDVQQYLRESERCAGMMRDRLALQKVYEIMGEMYHQRKDYVNEFTHRELSMQYRDSIFGEGLANALVVTQVDFEQDRNRVLMAIQKASVDRQERQRQFMNITGGLLLFAIAVLLWDIRSRRKENTYLEQQVNVRTHELAERLQTSERRGFERRVWETKIMKAMNDHLASLEGLGQLVSSTGPDQRILAKIAALQDYLKNNV